jgi:hypothetical protein
VLPVRIRGAKKDEEGLVLGVGCWSLSAVSAAISAVLSHIAVALFFFFFLHVLRAFPVFRRRAVVEQKVKGE